MGMSVEGTDSDCQGLRQGAGAEQGDICSFTSVTHHSGHIPKEW